MGLSRKDAYKIISDYVYGDGFNESKGCWASDLAQILDNAGAFDPAPPADTTGKELQSLLFDLVLQAGNPNVQEDEVNRINDEIIARFGRPDTRPTRSELFRIWSVSFFDDENGREWETGMLSPEMYADAMIAAGFARENPDPAPELAVEGRVLDAMRDNSDVFCTLRADEQKRLIAEVIAEYGKVR